MPEESGKTQNSGRRGLFDRLGGRSQISPARQRLFVRLGIATLLLAALVIIPGYFASQSEFLERYPHMEAEYQTWGESVHAKIACRDCHVSPALTSQVTYSLRMLGEFYISLVSRSREPDILIKPSNAACSSCHVDLRTVSPSGDLNIPHRAHVEILEIKCIECHEYLVHELSPEGKHAPRMIACMRCHDGDQAKDACVTCHTAKAAPENHQSAEWVVVHPEMQREMDCAECHAWTEGWCAECHSRRPTSHIDRWRSKHRYRVEEHRNCEVCHEADFCIRCHGEVPDLNFDPSLELVE